MWVNIATLPMEIVNWLRASYGSCPCQWPIPLKMMLGQYSALTFAKQHPTCCMSSCEYLFNTLEHIVVKQHIMQGAEISDTGSITTALLADLENSTLNLTEGSNFLGAISATMMI